MSSVENRQNSTTPEQKPITGPLQMPGLISQHSSIEQLSFPDTTPQPAGTSHLSNYYSSPGVTRPLSTSVSAPTSSPGVTRPLPAPITSPSITRNLGEAQTGTLLP